MRPPRLKESCTIYSGVTRNRHGDVALGSATTATCLYRNIDQLSLGANAREEQNITGIFWFAANVSVALSDVIKYNGLLYKVENLTTAKDLLTHDTVQFYKALVSLYRAIS